MDISQPIELVLLCRQVLRLAASWKKPFELKSGIPSPRDLVIYINKDGSDLVV